MLLRNVTVKEMANHEGLFTVGEFARFARTTKRTVQYYDKKGLLKPHKADSETNYRYYQPRQIVDFQVLLLLRKLGFSIAQIKKYLRKSKTLEELFKIQRDVIKNEIMDLTRKLEHTEEYSRNLKKLGTLANPKIKKIDGYSIYGIRRTGPYAKIRDYCFELKGMFKEIPTGAAYLMIETQLSYRPKDATMLIGVVAKKGMKLRNKFKNSVEKIRIPGYRAVAYTHHGSGRLNSLLWDDLWAYFRKRKLKVNPEFPQIELYPRTSLNGVTDEDDHIFDMHIPIA